MSIGYTTRWMSLQDIHNWGSQVVYTVETDTELYNQLVPWGISTCFSKHKHWTPAHPNIRIKSQRCSVDLKLPKTWQTWPKKNRRPASDTDRKATAKYKPHPSSADQPHPPRRWVRLRSLSVHGCWVERILVLPANRGLSNCGEWSA